MAKTTKSARAIVNCADYNGHKNVLFMMEVTDHRFNNPEFGYAEVIKGVYSRKIFTGDNGIQYQVFQDWSVKPLKG